MFHLNDYCMDVTVTKKKKTLNEKIIKMLCPVWEGIFFSSFCVDVDHKINREFYDRHERDPQLGLK